MRADALQNRTALVAAARDLIVERGVDVPLEAVAERAGVGIGTLYRRFPDRESLLRAVAVETLGALGEAARQAAGEADAARSWRAFVTACVEVRIGAVVAALSPARDVDAPLDPEVGEVRERLLAAVDEVVAAGKRAGRIRRDVEPIEVLLAIIVATRPLPKVPEAAALAQRMLEFLEAGLRPG